MQIEVVHRAANRRDAALVVDALERHGINAFVQDPTPAGNPGDGAPSTIVRVWVRAEDARDANELLDAVGHHLPASLDNPPGEDDATGLA
jgi:hypothetical protein